MATSDSVPDVPAPADVLGAVGILVALVGVLLTAARLAWSVWEAFGWWSGPVYLGVGVGLLLAALLARLLYQRISEWRLERAAQRIREGARTGQQEGGE